MSEVGKSLIQGLEEALEYARGQPKGAIVHKVNVPEEIDVTAIREKLHMSRKKFSDEFGFSIRTLEKWERGERSPEGPARAYLTVIDKDSRAVMAALHQV